MKKRNTLKLLGVVSLFGLSACADKPASYFAPAPMATLKEPDAGMSALYLIRIPRDKPTLLININSKELLLPFEAYTVLTIKPGQYVLSGGAIDSSGNITEPFAATQVVLKEGQKKFLYTSVETRPSSPLSVFSLNGGIVAMPMRNAHGEAVPNTRRWTESNELDAQGMMSITNQVVN
ncbi:hypothetical protein GN316_15160 [Xylophilus sp. Kf1]|nr:hypothetical protein [Xylophilus sp. Kf1]